MIHEPTATSPIANLGDIYYVLFRHKWKIILCSVAGIAIASVLFRMDPPLYQSEAKLLVRYIISESRMTGPSSGATAKILTDERGASIMATEREILSSVDLASEVAQAIGPEKLLNKAGGGNDSGRAVAILRERLRVTVPPGSSVIHINFRHEDAQIVQPVLREVLDRYLKLHVATHRASGMLNDTLAQEADTLRARLAQTEEDLRKITTRAGVISLESAKDAYGAQLTAIRREIFSHEADLASKLAVFEELRKRGGTGPAADEMVREVPLPQAIRDKYQTLLARANRLQLLEQELSVQFTSDNPRLKGVREQLADAESNVNKMREEYPKLIGTTAQAIVKGGGDPFAEEAANSWIQITAFQAKIKELNSQFERLRAEVTKLEQAEGSILELRRKKEIDEANYRYYAANFEQARISETLGNGKVSNISQIQAPSPAFREITNYKKPVVSIFGGMLAGIVWAFLIELYFDRSVRKAGDLARLSRVPLFLSIPKLKIDAGDSSFAGVKPRELTMGPGEIKSAGSSVPQPTPSALLPFHETLRDRLIGFFESKDMTHKPKLVAITGLLSEAGVTTTATGLARSLSETVEGSVLLVDMTVGQGAAQQFMRGKAVCGLDQLLEARSQAHVHNNLYVVAESNGSDRLSRNLPKRFASLVPKLKASDFDYIIFDMPTVSQVNITPRLASFMDMVLLVVESETTDRDQVQAACLLFAESKTHVGVVLNKTRSYVPSRFNQDLLAN